MELVQTPDGPRLALDPEAVQILASESANPMIRQAAAAWLDHYRLCRLIGVSELAARLSVAEAWDSVAGPALRLRHKWKRNAEGDLGPLDLGRGVAYLTGMKNLLPNRVIV